MTEPQPSASTGFGGDGHTHGLDFAIRGHEMQFVEIELDPSESVVAEAGAMMFKSPTVEMDTVFGDGSGGNKGFMGSLLGAGKRLITGESLFTTIFTQQGAGKGRVALLRPIPAPSRR